MDAQKTLIETVAPAGPLGPCLVIRIHLADGTAQSFAQADKSEAQKIWQKVDPARLFALSRLVVAGEHFKAVFVSSQIVRVDFMHRAFGPWDFPGGYADLVELSEEEFRANARLDEPERMVRREDCTPVGDLLVSFLELRMLGGARFFLMAEVPVMLPAENQSFMRFLLSKGAFHMRLACGGFGVINLANLVSCTVYPGVAEVPADAWPAEPLASHPTI